MKYIITLVAALILFTGCAEKETYLAKQSGTVKEIRGGNALIVLDNGDEVILDDRGYSSGKRVNLLVK